MLLLIPLLPFLGFVINATIGRRWSKTLTGGIATAAMAAAFAVAASAVYTMLQLEPVGGVRAINEVTVSLGYLLGTPKSSRTTLPRYVKYWRQSG